MDHWFNIILSAAQRGRTDVIELVLSHPSTLAFKRHNNWFEDNIRKLFSAASDNHASTWFALAKHLPTRVTQAIVLEFIHKSPPDKIDDHFAVAFKYLTGKPPFELVASLIHKQRWSLYEQAMARSPHPGSCQAVAPLLGARPAQLRRIYRAFGKTRGALSPPAGNPDLRVTQKGMQGAENGWRLASLSVRFCLIWSVILVCAGARDWKVKQEARLIAAFAEPV